MLTASIKLKQKLKTIPLKKNKRQFLLDCISNNKDLSLVKTVIEETQNQDKTINFSNVCKICNNFDFSKDKSRETCNHCGYERPIMEQHRVFEKIEYVKPGSNIIKIQKDGKTTSVDLNKINQWLQDTDPYAKETSIIIETLDTIFNSKGIILPKYVQNTCISLWYNYNTLLNDSSQFVKSKFRSIKNKNILCLCIYYGCSIHNYIISLEQLSIIIKTNVSDITSANNLFKELFKDTDYYSKFNLSTTTCKIELTTKHKLVFNKIKEHLISNFPGLEKSFSNKDYASICYFISTKLNRNKLLKLTLKDISDACKVSTTTISSTSKNIEKFYEKNPKLYRELLI